MTVEETLEWAIDHDKQDLQTLIMFLVYEKKTLSLSDNSDKIDFYTQEKFHNKMNDHLNDYKQKLKITYKSNVFSIVTQTETLYTIAHSENEAKYTVGKQGYEVESIEPLSDDFEMVWLDEKGRETYTTIKQIKKQTMQVPKILGGFQ